MAATEAAAAPRRRRLTKGEFYRWCRLLHGWLSAFAFLVLCFFSVTGLLLNHQGWFENDASPAPINTTFELTQSELEQLANTKEPGYVLAEIAGKRTTLRGAYENGDEVGNEIFVRMRGVRGLSDIRANSTTGIVKVVVEPEPTTNVLNELHRGERAGLAWRWMIDAVAILLVVLSIIGYLIFLSMKFRLRTALILTGVSAVGFWAFFVTMVY
jgi:hypothetical protein